LVGNGVADAEFARSWRPERDVGILGEFGARVRGEDESSLELEHRDRTGWLRVVTLELGADDARRCQSEALAVELEGRLEVANRQGHTVDAWLHVGFPRDSKGARRVG